MLSLNSQPVEKPDYRGDGSLDIINIWYTIQGEGPFAGTPAVFVRLAGCNFQCPQCDTLYTSGRCRLPTGKLRQQVEEVERKAETRPGLVVLTGGEPFRQNITPLVTSLMAKGCRVQVETNGSLFLPDFPQSQTTIVCSPKGAKIPRDLWPHAWKYVLTAGEVDPADGLPTTVLGLPIRPARPFPNTPPEDVFVQPADEGEPAKNAANLREAVNSCLRFGYRLSLQLHKIIGLD